VENVPPPLRLPNSDIEAGGYPADLLVPPAASDQLRAALTARHTVLAT
jgi:hypothetical protein